MLPDSYNSNYQIIQSADSIVIHVEMIHDTRMIRLGGGPHLPSSIRLWKGDSVGRWEADTLVVDTTNFNDGGGFYGDAGGNFGWDRNLHLVERFSLLDKDTLLYRFEVDNPTAFTQPWKGELTMTRSTGPMYEFACHEGNYALPNMLNGERFIERQSSVAQVISTFANDTSSSRQPIRRPQRRAYEACAPHDDGFGGGDRGGVGGPCAIEGSVLSAPGR